MGPVLLTFPVLPHRYFYLMFALSHNQVCLVNPMNKTVYLDYFPFENGHLNVCLESTNLKKASTLWIELCRLWFY